MQARTVGAAWVKAQKSGKSLGWATGARTCSTKKGVKTCTQKFTKGKITYKGAPPIVRSGAKFMGGDITRVE